MQVESTYSQETHAIEVKVHPTYMEGHSKPEEGLYVWAYEVEIANNGQQTAQLLSRHWKITNAYGQTLEVRGPGVVGDQPVIRPGETYSYSSFTNLATPSGFMIGTYDMQFEATGVRTVAIPAFSLDSPEQTMLPN